MQEIEDQTKRIFEKFKPNKSQEEGEMAKELEKLEIQVKSEFKPHESQKVGEMANQLEKLEIQGKNEMGALVNFLFDQVKNEPESSATCAQMSVILLKKRVIEEETGMEINFRKLLISRCQAELEKDTKDLYKPEDPETDDWEEKAWKERLGIILFAGELYKLKMLTARIMHEVIRKLLRTDNEREFECLSKLLTSVGKDLEIETNKLLKEEHTEFGISVTPFSEFFRLIHIIIEGKNPYLNASFRIRFMLQDLAELRKQGWQSGCKTSPKQGWQSGCKTSPTPQQKLRKMAKEWEKLEIQGKNEMGALVNFLFDQVKNEPESSATCAQMSEILQKKRVIEEETGMEINFRKLLISRCQAEFEKDMKDVYKPENPETDDWEEKAWKERLGIILFAGELYKLKVLTARIMHEVIRKLLRTDNERELECLCKLLTSVGKDLEIETNERLKKRHLCAGITPFPEFFRQIQIIIEGKKPCLNVSRRIRFMLQDLVELRMTWHGCKAAPTPQRQPKNRNGFSYNRKVR